jgi:DNA modification methylase
MLDMLCDVNGTEHDLGPLTQRVRDQIRSPASLRVFDVLVKSANGATSCAVAEKAKVAHLGPAVHGIILAAKRAGVDPKRVYTSRGGKNATVMKSSLAGEATGTPARRRAASGAPLGLTSMEDAVLRELADDPLSAAILAGRARIGHADTRLALDGLVEKGFASLRGGGFTLASSATKARMRQGDVSGDRFVVLHGDAEERLGSIPDRTVDAFVMSPPYYKERDYGASGQIGWEATPDEFAGRLVGMLAECGRALAPHGLVFLNFDDRVNDGKQSCIDSKIMARLAETGLEKHREIIWRKTNPTPNGTDNALAHSYEKIFVFKKKGGRHYWDALTSRQDRKAGDGKKRLDDVWEIGVATSGHAKGSHYAAFPVELVRRCLEIGVSEKGQCPKCGAPWTRILKRGVSTWRAVGATHARSMAAAKKNGKADYNGARDERGVEPRKVMADMRHLRWEPSCGHRNAKPIRPLVVDPFVGSGTTGAVAMERSCDFLGIDINKDYVAKAAAVIRAARILAKRSEK